MDGFFKMIVEKAHMIAGISKPEFFLACGSADQWSDGFTDIPTLSPAQLEYEIVAEDFGRLGNTSSGFAQLQTIRIVNIGAEPVEDYYERDVRNPFLQTT